MKKFLKIKQLNPFFLLALFSTKLFSLTLLEIEVKISSLEELEKQAEEIKVSQEQNGIAMYGWNNEEKAKFEKRKSLVVNQVRLMSETNDRKKAHPFLITAYALKQKYEQQTDNPVSKEALDLWLESGIGEIDLEIIDRIKADFGYDDLYQNRRNLFRQNIIQITLEFMEKTLEKLLTDPDGEKQNNEDFFNAQKNNIYNYLGEKDLKNFLVENNFSSVFTNLGVMLTAEKRIEAIELAWNHLFKPKLEEIINLGDNNLKETAKTLLNNIKKLNPELRNIEESFMALYKLYFPKTFEDYQKDYPRLTLEQFINLKDNAERNGLELDLVLHLSLS